MSAPESLAEFFAASANPESSCLYVDPDSGGESIANYLDMYRNSLKTAKRLGELDLPKRFIAVIWMDQTPHCLEAFMAVVIAGGIPVPVHAFQQSREVSGILDQFEANAVLLTSRKWDLLLALEKGEEGRLLPAAYYVDGETGNVFPPPSSFAKMRRERAYKPPGETAAVFLTSGSTGSPKGVMLSDRNLLSNMMAIQQYARLGNDDRILLSKSFGYCSTITGEWLLALYAGADLQMTTVIHPFQTVSFIRRHGTTFLCTVPSAVLPLLKSNKWNPQDLKTLRQMLIVGAPMPAEMLIRLHDSLPWVHIVPGYGLTEASPRVTYLPAEDVRLKAHSAGIPVNGVEVGIYRQGVRLPPGEIGEIVVRGPNVMIGYFNDPGRTADVVSDHGLRTSDMGCMDEDGYLYLTGRADLAMSIGGHTVFPESIEQVLSRHPLVLEAAVTGIPDEIWGQRPIAYVMIAEQSGEEREIMQNLRQYCQQQLPAAHRPKEIVRVARLPRTRSGKLDRKQLLSMTKESGHAEHYG